jgi:D-glycero-alpha-D-manno-heptose-7-phosphate kinase
MQTIQRLEDSMLLFFTGVSRSASQILQDQDRRTKELDASMLENMDYVKLLGVQSLSALEAGDISKFGALMNEHWIWKQKRAGTCDERILELYRRGMEGGATSGKLIGAGGGGFLLFLVHPENKHRVRSAMQTQAEELRFRFDFQGVTRIV